MKIRTTLIIISILLFANSCTESNRKKTVVPLTKSEEVTLNFIKIQINYIDATIEWHHTIKDYNIYFDVIASKDTVEYDIYAGTLQPTWPVDEKFKYCYYVDNHYVFSNKKTFQSRIITDTKDSKRIRPQRLWRIYEN